MSTAGVEWAATDVTFLLAVMFAPALIVFCIALIKGFAVHITKHKITETPDHKEDQS